MRLEINRKGILVIPNSEEDEAYIEDTLGLLNDGDSIPLKRINAFALSSIAYLEATKEEHIKE